MAEQKMPSCYNKQKGGPPGQVLAVKSLNVKLETHFESLERNNSLIGSIM